LEDPLTEWWLSVFFFINGIWVPGDSIEGWASRPFASETVCLERKAYAERECKINPLIYETAWVCNKGAPADAPPFPEPAIEC
jgi:hypothetical protein